MLPPAIIPRQFGMASLIVGALCLKSVSAALVSTFEMGYATVDENTLYVHGGTQKGILLSDWEKVRQFYSLDLTKSWDTSSPPWTLLEIPHIDAATLLSSMTVSLDGKTLTTWSTSSYANYSIASHTWTQVPTGIDLKISRPATDPTTGTVYFPGGSVNSTIKYNFEQGQPIIESIPSTLVNIATLSAFVWCQARKSFFLFTGDTNTKNPFYEYTPSNSQWKALPTTGFNPPPKKGSCMESAYNGTKIILFGGIDNEVSSRPIGNIYILDVTSMIWTEGPVGEVRSGMACSVSGDNFLVWGGYHDRFYSNVGTTPLVYDINIGQWTTKYIRRSSVKPPTSSSSLTPLSPSPTSPNGLLSPEKGGDTGGGGGRGGDSKINGAVIGGGIAGGIAVIAAIVFVIIRRRRPRRGPDSTCSNDINNKHSEATSRHDQGFPSIENMSDGSAFGTGIILSKTYQQLDKPTNPQYISHKHSQGTLNYPAPQPKPSSPHGKALYPLPSFPPSPHLTTPPRPRPADPQHNHRYHQQQHQYQPYPMQDPSAWQYGYPQYHDPLAFTETTPLSSNTRGPQGMVKPSQAASNLELQERNLELQEQLIWMQTELSRRRTDQQQP